MKRKKSGNPGGRPRNKEQWVTDAEAAEVFGFSRQAIHEWRKIHPGAPKRRKDGRCKLSDIKAWLDHHGLRGKEDRTEEYQIRIARERLRLRREEFEFEQLRERMIPASAIDIALSRMTSAFRAALRSLKARANEKMEGLDFNDRGKVFDDEIEVLERTFEKCDYLGEPAGDNDEDLG